MPCFFSMGCTSFLAQQVMKDFQVEVPASEIRAATTEYQADFLYLKTLVDEVFPLADRYFSPGNRRVVEWEILRRLGDPGCSYETFVFSVRAYLARFDNQHAAVVRNPRPIHFFGFYPFRSHYVSNELYVIDISRQYDRSVIGQKITGINGMPIADVEQKMFSLVSAENLRAKRALMQPFYSGPHMYHVLGLSSSASNSVQLEFEGHSPVSVAPIWKGPVEWHGGRPAPHPITRRAPHQYDCQIVPDQHYAYLQFNACFDKAAILGGLETYVRPWIRPAIRTWLAVEFQRKKPSTVLRGIYDPERPFFKDYLAAAIRSMQQQGITNLVIDLRRNSGGERELCKQLLYHLTSRADLIDCSEFHYNPQVFSHYDPKEYEDYRLWHTKQFGVNPPSGQLLPPQQPGKAFFASVTDPSSPFHVAPERPVFTGKVILLVNENTGSAAASLAALVQDNRLGLIIGTTPANHATGPTGMTPFMLPRTRIMVSLPAEYMERAVPSNGLVLQPDCWVENSVADIQAWRDAVFEKALDAVNAR